MKKLLLIPALLSASVAFASPTKQIEISPMVGYNVAEGNLGFEDDGYTAYGVELQLNSKESSWSPEFSVITSYKGSAKDDIRVTRGMFNAVKTFDMISGVVPFAKVGLGAEMLSEDMQDNKSSLFVDAGAGLKVPFTESISLKAEAIYMNKYNEARYDNNLLLMAGLNFAFGDFAQKPAPKPVVVEKDSDNDGILDSQDSCANTPKGVKVDAKGCALDSDKDGVFDAQDKCPATALGIKVDAQGCALDLDIDKDGVANALDKCPNTPLHSRVDTNGCAEMVTLKVNFKSNSTEPEEASMKSIDAFVAFMKIQKTYKTRLVGYTDSRGSVAYNLKLSEKRANDVKNIIISKGISADRITAIGKGESNPIATNMYKAGREKNRRIEAELIK